MNKVALVEFPRSSFGQKYSYLTNIKDLKPDDIVLVQTRTSYSLAIFKEYTDKETFVNVADKWIVKNLTRDIEEFEDDLLLM